MKLEQLKIQFEPPAFGLAEAEEILARCYGLAGQLSPLVGERDQNFKLETDDGRLFVLKISGATEDAKTVDFQVKALAHIAKVAPRLPIPKDQIDKNGELYSRQTMSDGQSHLIRLVTYLAGSPLLSLGPDCRGAIYEMGQTQGQICRALSSFFHPTAAYAMPWNTSKGMMLEPEFVSLLDADQAARFRPHADRLLTETLPALQALRSQVIHNDVHTGNVLLDESGRVSGIIDFGDIVFAPLIQDLAVSAASIADFCPSDPGPAIQELVRGFCSTFPLLPEERELLGDAILLRSLLCVQLCEFKVRKQRDSEHQERILADSKDGLTALFRWHQENHKGRLKIAGHKDTSLPTFRTGQQKAEIIERRQQYLSPSYKLFYDEPLYFVRGSGALLYDNEGREYLDGYNNVPSVGHCHPHVVDALRAQAETLNTHTRYLHDGVLTYAERLTATLPADLDMCVFVCTGTEANDLAYQMACKVTGNRGAAVSEGGYHGNSLSVAELSLYGKRPQDHPAHVAAIPLPDCYRGPYAEDECDLGRMFAGLATQAIEDLSRSPFGFSMLMIDPIFDAGGIFTAPDGYLAELFAMARKAGGLVVADEVQSGLCRLGDHMWGFQDSDVTPDIVTMGKPMGDGHPIGVVVAKRWIFETFSKDNHYFNTFGGNPVSAAVGNAVLDVIESENVLSNVHNVGRQLKAGLESLKERHEVIGDVRGKGFFLGVDLVADRSSRNPAPAAAHAVINAMRHEGVLVTVNGLYDNVIKIRPPLIFSSQNADRLLDALDTVLKDLPAEFLPNST